MSKIWKRAAIIAGIALLAVAAMLIVLDQALRSIVVQTVTSISGRQLSIKGDFDVDYFPWPPRVRAEQVSFANADWGTEPTMLDVQALEFTIELLPLLRGQLVAPEVILTSPNVVLERSRDGRRNWILSPDQTGTETGPRLGKLVVNGGSLIYRDPNSATELFLGIATNPASGKPSEAITFSVNGRLRGVPFSASGTGGEVLALRDTSNPFPIDARFQLAGVRGTIDGTVTGLTSLTAYDFALTLSGKDLARLAPLVDVPIDVLAFKAAGRLSHRDRQWSFTGFDANVGESHLAGTLQIDLAGAQPSFSGNVSSKLIDVDTLRQLAESAAKPKSTQKKPGGWTARLREFNGELRFTAGRVRDAPIPIDSASGSLRLANGVATIDPLVLGVAGGRINSSVRLDASKTPAAAQVSARIEDLALNRLFPASALAKGVGGLGGQVKLTAQGDSFDTLLASSDGQAEFVITGGQIDARLLQLLQLDAGSIFRYVFGGNSNVPLNCAIADFKINDGTLNTQTFVIDTPRVTVAIEGSIDVADRTLDLRVNPVSSGFSLFSAPVPVHITGSFSDPNIRADSSIFVRGGAALLLGLINPLAALLPLIDLGGEKAAPCAELLKKAEAAKPAK